MVDHIWKIHPTSTKWEICIACKLKRTPTNGKKYFYVDDDLLLFPRPCTPSLHHLASIYMEKQND